MIARATVVGAGLAGLSAAVRLREAGVAVTLAEASAHAGGRCRSWHDRLLGLDLDNGNHLVLSGNRATMRLRATVGADPTTLRGPAEATFAFADLATGERWTVRPNPGPLPWWPFSRARRAPGSSALDHVRLAGLAGAGASETVADRVRPGGALWRRLLHPVLLAALNTEPAEGSARLAWAVLSETVGRGGRAMRPLVAHPTLAAAFVDPALAWLAARGSPVAPARRLRALAFDGDAVSRLDWSDGPQTIARDEAVVLAVPARAAAQLVPDLTVPDAHRAIVNAHFATAAPPGVPPILGLLGATAEWLFAFPDRISVTVSAADRLVGLDHEALARRFWIEIIRAYAINAPMPPWRIIVEKRATFTATPDQDARRPPAATRWRNLFLAGDWTRTGLPATIEGAIRSGETAALAALGLRDQPVASAGRRSAAGSAKT